MSELGKIQNIRLDQKHVYGWMQIFKNFNLSTVKLLYNEHNIFYEEKVTEKRPIFCDARSHYDN